MKETGAIRLIFNWIFQWATTLDHSFQNEIICTNPTHSFLLVATDKYGYKWWVSLRAVSLFSITTVASVADVVCWFWMLNFLYTDIGIGCGLKWLFVFDWIRYGYFFSLSFCLNRQLNTAHLCIRWQNCEWFQENWLNVSHVLNRIKRKSPT